MTKVVGLLTQCASEREQHRDFLTVLPHLLPRINALASKFAAPCDYEDMVQEGLIALFESVASYDPSRDVPFDAFALVCVKRRMISAARKNEKFSRSHISDLDDSEDLVSTLPAPDEYAQGREDYAILLGLLKSRLSDYELRVMSLFVEGFSYKDIAARTGKTPKSAENALTRVRSKLSRWLAEPR